MILKLIQLIVLLSYNAVVSASEDEERLVRDLFRDYNKLIRPVEMPNMTVEVRFSMSLIQLINVNEKNQVMTVNVWLDLRWKDYQLKWLESDYGQISVIRLPADKIWRPDIVLFNNADGNYEVKYKCNALIYSDGSVHWIPPAIFRSTCQIDVTYFPFDEQKCSMKFSSWTFNGDQVSLEFEKGGFVDLSDYWKSGSWDIVEAPASLNKYNNTGHPTETDITFHITIRRKTLFYTVNLILPTLLISFLCILVFYLPVDSGEKVTLGISILLSLVVFLLLVSKILPPTSLVLPLIAKYLLFTFVMNCVSILITVIVINYNFRGPRTHKMPGWTRIIFLYYLPILLFLRRPKRTRLQWMRDMPALSSNTERRQQTESVKNSKKNESNKESHFSGSQTLQRTNSLKTKNLNSTKQASTSSQQMYLEQEKTVPQTLESSSKQPLQQLNVTHLPLSSNLLQPFQTPSRFHHNALTSHFHQTPLLLQATQNPTIRTTCTLSPQPELHDFNQLNTNQQTISNLYHTHYGSNAHLLRIIENGKLINTNFDPPNHLLSNSNLNPTNLNSHTCLPLDNKNDHFDENLNQLNLNHDINNHSNHNLLRNETDENNIDHCTIPKRRSMQPTLSNKFDNLNNQKYNDSTDLDPYPNKQINQQASFDSNSSNSSFYLSPAAFKATEAIEFIAENVRNEDEYIQIREDWKFVAMVIDRLQLYIFFLVTVFGTMAIILDAPHIWDDVINQDEVIRAHTDNF